MFTVLLQWHAQAMPNAWALGKKCPEKGADEGWGQRHSTAAIHPIQVHTKTPTHAHAPNPLHLRPCNARHPCRHALPCHRGPHLIAIHVLLLRLVKVDAVGGLAHVRQAVTLLHLAQPLAAAPFLDLHARG
eukprot:360650-Chlamydomonas_euryale.AAC.3